MRRKVPITAKELDHFLRGVHSFWTDGSEATSFKNSQNKVRYVGAVVQEWT